MSRYVRDPWAKKSKKGMKTLGKMFNTATNIGSALYANAQTKEKATTNNMPSNTPFPIIGMIVFFIGLILAFGVMLIQKSFLAGLLSFFIILILTIAFTFIAHFLFGNINDKNGQIDTNKSNTTSKNIIPKELVDELSETILNMSSIEDIEVCVKKLDPIFKKEELMTRSIDSALLQVCNQVEVDSNFEKYIDTLVLKYPSLETKLQNLSSYVEFIKLLIIQDMLNGIIPKRITLDINPINMHPSETPIFVFQNVVYYEEATTKTYLGASNGISVKVCKGVYYRMGAFKGEPLITTSLKPKYGGDLIFTNKNIYFYSKEKSMKFSYSKILSYVPSEDAIGIQLDKANAKTFYIKNIDGRFAFNIVTNIGIINN